MAWTTRLFFSAALSVTWGAFGAFTAAGEREVLQEPVRLMADNHYIDTGDAIGHSGPCLADIDDDGDRDLVVGDFSGKFRLYRNTGTDLKPQYAAHTYLEAGAEAAQVPIY